MHSTLFGSSTLVRVLDAWTPVDAVASGGDVAERMSGWVGPLDAIRLQAVHHALRGTAEGATQKAPAAKGSAARLAAALAEDLQRARGVLAKAIAQDPLALGNILPGEDAGYAPWHQRQLELQRQMGQMIGALRDHARQAVSRASPRLHQLAVLDAAFEELLAAREQSLLPTTAALLERRYHQLRRAPAPAADDADGTAGAPPSPPADSLAAFAHDWRQALLAELDLRLEPVAGLLDALRHESGSQA